jgi:hypothetical protein
VKIGTLVVLGGGAYLIGTPNGQQILRQLTGGAWSVGGLQPGQPFPVANRPGTPPAASQTPIPGPAPPASGSRCTPTQDGDNYVGAWQTGYTVVVGGQRLGDPQNGGTLVWPASELGRAQQYFNRVRCGG